MIDTKTASEQISGIAREVMRRYSDANDRAKVADAMVAAIEAVEEHLARKMAPSAPVAPVMAAASSAPAKGGKR